MNDRIFIWLLTAALLFWLYWEFSPIDKYKGVSTLQYSEEYCYNSEECKNIYYRIRFKPIVEQQIVLGLSEVAGYNFVLERCRVFDQDNWFCPDPAFMDSYLKRHNGEWEITDQSLNIYSWRTSWYLDQQDN